jgi:hypothetical protein
LHVVDAAVVEIGQVILLPVVGGLTDGFTTCFETVHMLRRGSTSCQILTATTNLINNTRCQRSINAFIAAREVRRRSAVATVGVASKDSVLFMTLQTFDTATPATDTYRLKTADQWKGSAGIIVLSTYRAVGDDAR